MNYKSKKSHINYNLNTLLEKKKKCQHIEYQITENIKYLEQKKINKQLQNMHLINEKLDYYKPLLIFYKNKIKDVSNLLKAKCDHIIVNDTIDISLDESQNIRYCDKCETTF